MSEPITFRQRLAQNTAASMGTNVWTMVLTLASLPIVLRGLGAEAFGVWVFLQTFSATSGWLSIPAVGLATSTTRRVASTLSAEQDVRGKSVGNAFAAFTISGTVFGVSLAFLVPTILDRSLDLGGTVGSLPAIGAAFGLQVLAEHVSQAVTSVLEGNQRVALARLIDALRKTSMAVSVATLATVEHSLQAVAWANAASAAVVAVGAVIVVIRGRWIIISRPSVAETVGLVRYGATVGALAGTGVLHRTMDRTIAGVGFGPGAVALVEIANQIQAGSTALLSASTYPVLSSAPMLHSARDQAALRALFARTTRYAVLLTMPVCALSMVLAGPLIRVWVGTDFVPAIGLTQVAVVYVLLAAPVQAGSNLLQGTGKGRSVLSASLISVATNLVASLIFVQFWGLVGVFYGTLVGASVLIPLLLRALGIALGERPHQTVVDAIRGGVVPAAVSGGAAGVVLATGWSPSVQLVVGVLVGGCALIIATFTWSIRRGERDELLAALRVRRPRS